MKLKDYLKESLTRLLRKEFIALSNNDYVKGIICNDNTGDYKLFFKNKKFYISYEFHTRESIELSSLTGFDPMPMYNSFELDKEKLFDLLEEEYKYSYDDIFEKLHRDIEENY